MRKVSKNQAKRNREYLKLRDEFLDQNPICMIEGCNNYSTLHHSKGRIGDNLTDVSTFRNLCWEHHQYVELHPKWAKENGYSQSRLSK